MYVTFKLIQFNFIKVLSITYSKVTNGINKTSITFTMSALNWVCLIKASELLEKTFLSKSASSPNTSVFKVNNYPDIKDAIIIIVLVQMDKMNQVHSC